MNAKDALRAALTTSHDWILQLAEDMADAPMTAPTPNGGNHPMWIVGHAAASRAGLLSMISGRPNPLEHWDERFGGGTEPTPDAAAYPPFDEVLAAFRRMHQDALALLDEAGEGDLDKTPKALWDALRDNPDFQTNGRLFLFIAMHEMSHRGQLADARRAAGRKPFV